MILVDSSVAFKWLKSKDEPHRKQAAAFLERHVRGEIRLITLNLLFIEIANALSTKTVSTPKMIRTSLHALYDFGLEIYKESQDDIVLASLLARKHNTSVYDMLYAVIAKKAGVELITADEQFVRKTKFPYVKLLSAYDPQ